MTPRQLESIARGMLEGAGDALAFEHGEWTGRAYHLRRRLTSEEQKHVGPAVDIRGTEEAVFRVKSARGAAPHIPLEYFARELATL